MKIFISPAKSLDLKSDIPNIKYSIPIFTKEASKINSVLKQKSEKSLAELMNLSQKLSMLNWERNQSFEIEIEEIKKFYPGSLLSSPK